MGYAVTWWDERASSATLYKLALRALPAATVRWSEQTFKKRLELLRGAPITHILVIKGEGLSLRMTREISRAFPSASIGLYLWDGFENIRGLSKILPAFDSVASFDPIDAAKFDWTYRPLFSRDVARGKPKEDVTNFDWCFIGTIHSDRHRVIDRLRKRYGTVARSFVYAFFQSPLVLLLRRCSDRTLWFAPKGTLSTKPMSADAVAEIVAQSRAVLDIEHPQQRGFTMRTIETLLSGKKLLTTNKHILDSDLYHPSRVQIIERGDPEITSGFLNCPFVQVDESVRKYYACENWVAELLALQDLAKKKSAFPAG
ncbi:hypothetical protein CR103_09490 [Massilia psychrophila]|uniref:Lipopolysaccharide biosynthesis protein n=2 Tax=Massilia psychrophila TaxID=1603353 RepID=A0A2G8T1Q7_9BURK|nr:hypothetical protein CR103_09490 [Massilia psychrophila]